MGRLLRFRKPSATADLLIALIVGVAVFIAVLWMKPAETSQAAPVAGLVGIARVIDGDTLEVATGQGMVRVRLDGMDAFEGRQTCGGAPCGREASRALMALADNRRVECADRGRDRYDRVLAHCRIDGRDLGGWMVENGHAVAYRRYSQAYVPHETRARAAGAGAWAHGFDAPEDWRHAR
ncbi:thermonuclease family protein [Brevundimonas sp.]|uniref:thermonuclease family protein n=1 Tax=Brevundimonas sp. TaxID=1871086 RepID=UPI0035B044EB